MMDIDNLLRGDARNFVADEGFAARVMDALPRRASRAPAWMRPALVAGAALTGSALAVTLAPAGVSLRAGFADILQLGTVTPAALSAIAIAATLLVSALVLALDPE